MSQHFNEMLVSSTNFSQHFEKFCNIFRNIGRKPYIRRQSGGAPAAGPQRSATDVQLHDRGARADAAARPWCSTRARRRASAAAVARMMVGVGAAAGRMELTAAQTLGAHMGTDRRHREGGGRR
jgi:hypothetical protein